MKILISDSLEQSCIDILASEHFEVDNKPGIAPDELKRVIGGYDALVVRSSTKVTADVISAGERLKVIGRAGTGVDNIDVDAATRRGVLVINTPGGNTISAAEHAVSMMLSMARNIPQAHKSLTAGEWERKRFTGTEVFEKTIGIIGLGKIGREVAQRCQGLGMKVLGYDPVIAADTASKQNIELVSLEEIYRRSDFISVHTPLTKETRGLLNDETLKKCKKGVRVINCARGGIIDEAALFRALETGHVAGAALDVFEQEPPHASPLLKHPRVVVTPHLGASTEEAQEKVAIQIAHSLTDALLGRGFSGVVNSTSMHLMLNAEVRPYVLLAEKLGSLAAQLTPGKVRRVTVGAAGDVVVSTLELLKAGILKGILSHTVPDPVNVISAPFIAKDLGLVVGEEKGGATDNFPTVVRLRYETEQETRELAGAVFGTSAIRLIAMDGFRFDVNPEGYLLIYYNIDKPGMLARVGTVLAKHQVNIAGLSLGRVEVGGNALTIVNIDTDVPPAAVRELLGIEGVSNLKVVRIA